MQAYRQDYCQTGSGYGSGTGQSYGSGAGYGSSAGYGSGAGYGSSAGYGSGQQKLYGPSTQVQHSSTHHSTHGTAHGLGHGIGYGHGQAHGYSTGGGMKANQYSTAGGHGHHQTMASLSMMTVFGQDAFYDIQPSSFPPGTDPKVIECYNKIDRDNNGVIDDKELQSVLSTCSHSFGMRTVHLLMYEFTHSNKRIIGPKEFVPLLKCLTTWRSLFQRFDRNRDGSIDSSELGQALSSTGFRVSPIIVNLLVSKFSSSTGHCALHYDSFIECCLTVKGLTETFNAKADCGKASFYYEEFLLNVLPFVIA